MKAMRHLVATVPPEQLRDLEPGVNCLSVPSAAAGSPRTPVLVYSRHGSSVDRACRNRCAHQAGRFVPDLEEAAGQPFKKNLTPTPTRNPKPEKVATVKCTSHGWRLDLATMRYVDPPELRSQEEFELVSFENGGVGLWEGEREEPWRDGAKEALQAAASSFLRLACFSRLHAGPHMVGGRSVRASPRGSSESATSRMHRFWFTQGDALWRWTRGSKAPNPTTERERAHM